MANTVLAGLAMPGGELVAGMGGYVSVGEGACDIANLGNSAATIFVSRWIGRFIYRESEVTMSGNFGGVARRRVGYDWMARIEVAYDVSNPPDIVLNNRASVGLLLLCGDPTAYKADNLVKRYALPSGLLSNVETINDGSATDVVRQTAEVKGNSVFFLLPNEQQEYTAYITALQNRGWLG